MHRAVLLAQGELIGAEAIELPEVPSTVPSAMPGAAAVADAAPASTMKPVTQLVGQKMEVVERDLILETLTHCLGNRTRAAEILGISIRTLRNKLHDYRAQGVPVPGVPGMLPPGFYAQGA